MNRAYFCLAYCIFIAVFANAFRTSPRKRRVCKICLEFQDILSNTDVTTISLAGVGALGTMKFLSYAKIAYATASTINGIPDNFKVTEIDAKVTEPLSHI